MTHLRDSLVVPSADGGADMDFLEDVNESEDERDSHRNLPSGLQPDLVCSLLIKTFGP